MQGPQYAFTIDLGTILRKKFGKVPGFVVAFLRRLIHEDFLNEFFRRGWEGVDFADECLKYLDVTIQIEGLDNLDPSGRYTIASNHPLGGIDAIGLISEFGNYFHGDLKFQVNDFLMYLKGLNSTFVPVNKTGRQSRELALGTDAIFAAEGQIGVFPAGKVSRKIDGVIQDGPWTKTFIQKSVQFRRDIVPVHFYGRNSNRFYRVDRMAGWLGLNKKFPLAMILLPDELYKGQHKTYRIVVGKPIPWQTFDSTRKPLEWAAWVREQAYNL